MAEFECWPLWQVKDDGRVNIDPATVGLPQDLVDGLNLWADRFDETYLASDPMASRFPDEGVEDAFYADGFHLAVRVAQSLDATVAYYDGSAGETHEVVPADRDGRDNGA